MDRQAALQDKIDALGAWEIDTKQWTHCVRQMVIHNQKLSGGASSCSIMSFVVATA
jgi:hypothetical protein